MAPTRIFSLHQNVLMRSGAHPVSYSMGAGNKGAEAWSWPLSSIAEVKNVWNFLSCSSRIVRIFTKKFTCNYVGDNVLLCCIKQVLIGK